jgi:hypothetical protein
MYFGRLTLLGSTRCENPSIVSHSACTLMTTSSKIAVDLTEPGANQAPVGDRPHHPLVGQRTGVDAAACSGTRLFAAIEISFGIDLKKAEKSDALRSAHPIMSILCNNVLFDRFGRRYIGIAGASLAFL